MVFKLKKFDTEINVCYIQLIGTQATLKKLQAHIAFKHSEQGNAAEMRQVNPLMQKAKRRGSGKQIQPQVYHVLSYKDLVSSRCSE